jgi:putative heme-binding domain-containing protein
VNYALTLPQIDFRYDLSGVEAAWQSKSTAPWTGWLPHLDLGVARQLTVGSAEHDELWSRMAEPGTLTLRGKLNLHDMLRPAVQPGAKIDYVWPPETVTLVIRAKIDFVVTTPAQTVRSVADGNGWRVARITHVSKPDELLPYQIVIACDGGAPELDVSYHTNEDSRPRALPLHRLLLPWPTFKKGESAQVERDRPELQGGNWARGRKVFFSESANCSKCHAISGEGGAIGPDLGNLSQRDYASVFRDIAQPSYAINPDYITYRVALKNGRVLHGTVRSDGPRLQIGDMQGQVTTIERDHVESLESSPVSIMPEGLPEQLGADSLRDLLTFLLAPPPRMPDYGPEPPPPPRSIQEVKAALAGEPANRSKNRPLHVVLVAGRKDHGPGEHDYPAWLTTWMKLLSMAEDVTVTTALEWPSASDIKSADTIVFYQQGRWTRDRANDIDAHLARGGGLVYIHFAVDGGTDAPSFAQRIGLAWRGGESRFRHGALDLGFATGVDHPIARNFEKLRLHDESYWRLTGDPNRIKLLASDSEEGHQQPLFWTIEPSKGRVFVSIPGHFAWTFDDPLYRILLLRGIAWTARESVDRFNLLVLPGARVEK